jgi:hypothetical protein
MSGWACAKEEYYSYDAALRNRFPNYKNAPQVQFGLSLIEAGEAMIDKFMRDREESEDNDD